MAMLLISSMITTVLPTPAPPNRPILPPLAYGASRSTTLIPVMRISSALPMSASVGGSTWMGARLSVGIGPRPSMASPTTSMMRPSVSGPTGTEMGAPVSATSRPRAKPSVGPRAMVRTALSPRCCATSSTTLKSDVAKVESFSASSGETILPLSSAERPASAASSSALVFSRSAMPEPRPSLSASLISFSSWSYCQSSSALAPRSVSRAALRIVLAPPDALNSESLAFRSAMALVTSSIRRGSMEIWRTYSFSGEWISFCTVTVRALRMAGTSLVSSNSTSTTAPITCDTRPLAMVRDRAGDHWARAAGAATARTALVNMLVGWVGVL
mmetsp:Transcript_149679/g.363554  ORF Transcript_149679/g.363554 Transcript_149679/m.363554 type:complete len:329 (-) Transcript_149679:10-996(-)